MWIATGGLASRLAIFATALPAIISAARSSLDLPFRSRRVVWYTRFLRGFLRYAIPSANFNARSSDLSSRLQERALKFSYCTYAGMGNTKEISLNLYSHHDFKNIFKMFHIIEYKIGKAKKLRFRFRWKWQGRLIKLYGKKWPKFEQVSKKVSTPRMLGFFAYDE